MKESREFSHLFPAESSAVGWKIDLLIPAEYFTGGGQTVEPTEFAEQTGY